jgi:hypothetical protein
MSGKSSEYIAQGKNVEEGSGKPTTQEIDWLLVFLALGYITVLIQCHGLHPR